MKTDARSKTPRLDKRTRAGLQALAALVEAGSCADIFGSTEDQMWQDGRLKEWENVLHACEWIRTLRE